MVSERQQQLEEDIDPRHPSGRGNLRLALTTAVAIFVLAGTGAVAAAAEGFLPPIDTNYDSQLGGGYRPAEGVGIVSRDRTADPAPGLYNICYVNAFQTQPDELAWWLENHPRLLLRKEGQLLEDANWPGEYILDISSSANRVQIAEIIGDWIRGCAEAGFQSIEPDNLDSWTRSGGLLSMDHATAYATLLASRAHDEGLAIAQKNGVELLEFGPELGFDFAVVESCAVYDECDEYSAVYGRYVLQVEYADTGRELFELACEERGKSDVIVLRDRALAPTGEPDHVFETCR